MEGVGQSTQRAPWRLAGLAAGLEVFVSLGALGGGGALILAPDGHLLGMPQSLLAGTVFGSFLVPGILVFGGVGVLPLLVSMATARGWRAADLGAIAIGVVLGIWIVAERVMLKIPEGMSGALHLVWAMYLAVGAGLVGIGAT